MSNIETPSADTDTDADAHAHGDEFEVGRNPVLYDHAVWATRDTRRLWAGRATHRLRSKPSTAFARLPRKL